MIVVTGATGALGGGIVRSLLARVPAEKIGASVRDLSKAVGLAELGVRVRQGDFDDRDSLLRAFDGATQVLIVSSNAASRGGDPLAQHRTAIDAAIAVGAGRIVYTSHMGASPTSAFPPMRDHAATEAMLQQSGLSWAGLRNGFYAESALPLMGDFHATGRVEAPEDGKVSWTAHADLAEAAAIVLTDPGGHEGPTPALTGSEALDLSDLTAIASHLLGHDMRRETISDELLRTRLTARGMPDAVMGIVLGLYEASRNGEFNKVDPTLERMLGRRPIAMSRVLADAFNL